MIKQFQQQIFLKNILRRKKLNKGEKKHKEFGTLFEVPIHIERNNLRIDLKLNIFNYYCGVLWNKFVENYHHIL